MNSFSEENVVPIPVCQGRKKTPWRKRLNALKNPNCSKLPPSVMTCRPRNRLKLFVTCQTSWSRMLWI